MKPYRNLRFLLIGFFVGLFGLGIQAQNVGIGTTSPNAKLQVNSDNTGTGTANWIAGSFGSSGNAADRLVLGTINSKAAIGGHNFNLSGWAPLLLNPVAGNVGVGTFNPLSTLHINGDLRLQSGVFANSISADSLFINASDSVLPTQNAIKRYLQKGLWAPQSGQVQSEVIFKDSTGTNLNNPGYVFVRGNYAYVTTGALSRFCIFDVSNPENIVALGFTQQNLNGANGVFVVGNFAYVASFNNSRLCIFDVSNPNSIVARGFTETNLVNPDAIKVQGSYAYVTSRTNNRLCIFDISNPDNIVAKGFSNQGLNSPLDVAIQGNFAYVASFNTSRIAIFDVSNPDAIVPKGFTAQNLSGPISLAVKDNYVYVASRFNDRLCVFDVSNPNAIVAKGFTGDGLDDPQSVFLQGDYGYVISNDNKSLCLFEISNPISPKFVTSNNTHLNDPADIHVQGNYAFVTSRENDRLVSFQLFNTTRSMVLNNEGELELEPTTWLNNNDNIYRTFGNVGIGHLNPEHKLSIGDATTDNQVVLLRGYGSSPPNWKGGAAFGFNQASVIMGQLTNVATIGGHNGSLSGWATLAINPGGGNVGIGTVAPNQKLDVLGSVGFPIIATSVNLILDANHYTVIISAAVTLTLPAANVCARRMYIIVNRTNGNRSFTSNYLGIDGTSKAVIPAFAALILQSDGANWYQIQ